MLDFRIFPRGRLAQCALMLLMIAALPLAFAETPAVPPQLVDIAEGPEVLKVLAPRTVADVLDAANPNPGANADGPPRVGIAIDGEVYPGSWRKLEGRVASPNDSAEVLKNMEFEWIQSPAQNADPEAFFKNADLWLFLIKPGNYAFTFRAKNEKGWSAASEVRFAVMQGRPYLSEQDGFQRVGSCERVVLPGTGWRRLPDRPPHFAPPKMASRFDRTMRDCTSSKHRELKMAWQNGAAYSSRSRRTERLAIAAPSRICRRRSLDSQVVR